MAGAAGGAQATLPTLPSLRKVQLVMDVGGGGMTVRFFPDGFRLVVGKMTVPSWQFGTKTPGR